MGRHPYPNLTFKHQVDTKTLTSPSSSLFLALTRKIGEKILQVKSSQGINQGLAPDHVSLYKLTSLSFRKLCNNTECAMVDYFH